MYTGVSKHQSAAMEESQTDRPSKKKHNGGKPQRMEFTIVACGSLLLYIAIVFGETAWLLKKF
jgi:hypothetical protein